MLFREFEINSKVYYFFKFIIIFILILIIYNYYFNLENFASNFEADTNLNSVFNENNLIVGDLVITKSFNLVPKGSIVAWRSEEIIPTGWAICDGTNDTPDLRGRFIVGSGQGNDLSDRKVGDSGGEEKHVLEENEIPDHGHSINIYSGFSVCYNTWLCCPSCGNVLVDGNGPYDTTLNPNDEKDKELKTQGHENMPPFYILFYIMKL